MTYYGSMGFHKGPFWSHEQEQKKTDILTRTHHVMCLSNHNRPSPISPHFHLETHAGVQEIKVTVGVEVVEVVTGGR